MFYLSGRVTLVTLYDEIKIFELRESEPRLSISSSGMVTLVTIPECDARSRNLRLLVNHPRYLSNY